MYNSNNRTISNAKFSEFLQNSINSSKIEEVHKFNYFRITKNRDNFLQLEVLGKNFLCLMVKRIYIYFFLFTHVLKINRNISVGLQLKQKGKTHIKSVIFYNKNKHINLNCINSEKCKRKPCNCSILWKKMKYIKLYLYCPNMSHVKHMAWFQKNKTKFYFFMIQFNIGKRYLYRIFKLFLLYSSLLCNVMYLFLVDAESCLFISIWNSSWSFYVPRDV